MGRGESGRRRGCGRTARGPDHPARKIVLRTAAPGGAPRGAAGPVILGREASSPERGCKNMLRLTRSIPPGRVARASLAAALALAAVFGLTALGWAAEPQPWQLNFQPPATPVMERLVGFHDELLVIITLITIFVLGLLAYVMVRFHHTRHPLPTRTLHNPVIEILWTVLPVLILVLIAIPSFKLMYYMDRTPNADMTIKVTAHQWYWSYEYPDQGGLGFDSNLIQD